MTAPPSTAVVRNASLRTAARAAYPKLKVGVRNGRDGYCAVSWVDGPTTNDMAATLGAVLGPTGRPWAISYHRSVSGLIVAVSYLRAHATGRRYFTEEAGCPREHDAYGRFGTIWSVLEDTVRAETVTTEEKLTAAALVAVAGVEQDALTCVWTDDTDTARELSWLRWDLAHTLYHHADVIHAALD